MLMLAIMMIPGVMTLIPSYVLYANLGLVNTPWVIIISAARADRFSARFVQELHGGHFQRAV